MGGVTGSMSQPGGAPKPDPERVATLRYTIVDEPETCAAFGETARAALASLNDRALAETRSGDLGECSLLLDHVHDRVAGLDPARLEPRRGVAGLFDSRARRLKAFRAAWTSAATAVTRSAADIGDRAGALARKSTALENLWTETRDAIADLDAHIAAARGWLANPSTPRAEPETAVQPDASEPADEPHEPVEAQADAEALHAHATPAVVDTPALALPEAGDASASAVITDPVEPAPDAEIAVETPSEPAPAREPAPIASLPHPLETRLAALEAVRATAIGRLPLLRAAQNADCRAPAALKQVCDSVEAWRAEWQDALGLAGKKPKKIRPDRVRLANASSALTDHLTIAGRDVAAAQGRRAELDARSAPMPAPASLAA